MSAQPNSSVPSGIPTELDMAAQAWREAKAKEEKARLARLDAESKIIELVGVKDEGSFSITTDYFKVSTTGKMTRRLDDAAYMAIREDLPLGLDPVVLRPAIDMKAFRQLEKHPEVMRLFSVCLTTKPAKPSVKVEVL
jgi:hypothetical protein